MDGLRSVMRETNGTTVAGNIENSLKISLMANRFEIQHCLSHATIQRSSGARTCTLTNLGENVETRRFYFRAILDFKTLSVGQDDHQDYDPLSLT
jgi:hypothetical protein